MNETAFFEDNNGGDIIEIISNEDGTFTFQVGFNCVYCLRKTGTISEITEWLTDLSSFAKDGFKTVERVFDVI